MKHTETSAETLKKLLSLLHLFSELLNSRKEFMTFLIHPLISHQEKISVCKKIFRDHDFDSVYNCFELLIQSDFFMKIKEITALVEKMYAEMTRTTAITIASAYELSPYEKKSLEKTLALNPHNQYTFTFVVKPHLIAGISIYIGNNRYDLSIFHTINDMYAFLQN